MQTNQLQIRNTEPRNRMCYRNRTALTSQLTFLLALANMWLTNTLKPQTNIAWETPRCLQQLHTWTQPTTGKYWHHNHQICIRNKNTIKIHSSPLTSSPTTNIKFACAIQINAKYTPNHHTCTRTCFVTFGLGGFVGRLGRHPKLWKRAEMTVPGSA